MLIDIIEFWVETITFIIKKYVFYGSKINKKILYNFQLYIITEHWNINNSAI